MGRVVQTCSAVVQVPGLDYEEQRRWWQVAVRKTVFGPWVRRSVVGSVEAEFGASGGRKEEEEGCAPAVAAVNGVEHVVVGSHSAQRKSSRWAPVTSVETERLRQTVRHLPL